MSLQKAIDNFLFGLEFGLGWIVAGGIAAIIARLFAGV